MVDLERCLLDQTGNPITLDHIDGDITIRQPRTGYITGSFQRYGLKGQNIVLAKSAIDHYKKWVEEDRLRQGRPDKHIRAIIFGGTVFVPNQSLEGRGSIEEHLPVIFHPTHVDTKFYDLIIRKDGKIDGKKWIVAVYNRNFPVKLF